VSRSRVDVFQSSQAAIHSQLFVFKTRIHSALIGGSI